jgi:CTP-dependent riboflavin kinase
MATYKRAMTPERDETTGRYVADHPSKEFLEAIDRLGTAGTQAIADEVGCQYQAAYKRLRALENDDRITRRKIANANLWVLVSDEAAEIEEVSA